MKKFIVWVNVVFILALKTEAQSLGFNGAGFFENYDANTLTWMDRWEKFTIRIPGGAIAKFADPYSNADGWGLSHNGVDSIQTKYGSPDEEATADALQKWHNRVNEQPDFSYLDDLSALQRRYPNMRVIWVANMFIPAQFTVNIVQQMKALGINVVAIEMGNETYSQFNYNFTAYWTKAQALRTAIRNSSLGNIPISQIAAPIGKGRKEQDQWNTDLDNNMAADDWVTMHYYLGSKEIKSMELLPGRKTVNYDDPDAQLQSTFSSIANELLNYPHSAISTAKTLFAGHTLLITETNTQPSEPLGDTFLNAAYQFRFLNTYNTTFNTIAWHNGVSPDVYGMICLRKKNEPGNTPLIRRSTYYSFELATQGIYPELAADVAIQFPDSGKYTFWFENATGSVYTPSFSLPDGAILDSTSIQYVTSPYLSSTSSTGFTIAHSVKNEVPAKSYGNITYYISKPKKPEVCYKKRWFFKSLGCKPDPKCQFNNCK